MSIEIEKPRIETGNLNGDMAAMKSYLYRITGVIENYLNALNEAVGKNATGLDTASGRIGSEENANEIYERMHGIIDRNANKTAEDVVKSDVNTTYINTAIGDSTTPSALNVTVKTVAKGAVNSDLTAQGTTDLKTSVGNVAKAAVEDAMDNDASSLYGTMIDAVDDNIRSNGGDLHGSVINVVAASAATSGSSLNNTILGAIEAGLDCVITTAAQAHDVVHTFSDAREGITPVFLAEADSWSSSASGSTGVFLKKIINGVTYGAILIVDAGSSSVKYNLNNGMGFGTWKTITAT